MGEDCPGSEVPDVSEEFSLPTVTPPPSGEAYVIAAAFNDIADAVTKIAASLLNLLFLAACLLVLNIFSYDFSFIFPP